MMDVVRNQKGVALVFALVITAAVLVTALGVLYFIDQATGMSGAGKRYKTAAEVSDGVVDISKHVINRVSAGDPVPDGIFDPANIACIEEAIAGMRESCNDVQVMLPGLVGTQFRAELSLEILFEGALAEARIQFPPVAGGAPGVGVFHRVRTRVRDGRNNTVTENAAVYRYVY